MAIIISKDGKGAKRIEETNFDYEDSLQEYIYNNPDAVPIYDIDENIRLLVIAREVSVGSGSIDAMGIDQNGDIYLIETKLFKNQDKRTVVAQVLDYGASLWKHGADFEDFLTPVEEQCQKNFELSLNEKLQEFYELETEEVAELLDNMQTNLNTGAFKFVVLMDKIEKRLKDLVLFLNQNSHFDVYAVEMEYYKHEGYEIVIPKVHGTDVKKNVASLQKSTNRKSWTKESFFEEINNNLEPDQKAAIRMLFEWAERRSDSIVYGTGMRTGSFMPKFDFMGNYSFIVCYSDGRVRLQFWEGGDSQKRLQKIIEPLRRNVSNESIFKQLEKAHSKKSHKDLPVKVVVNEVEGLIKAFDEFIDYFRLQN